MPIPSARVTLSRLLLGIFLLGFSSMATPVELAEQLPRVRDLLPTADRLETLPGPPPYALVRAGETLLGYALLTGQVKPIPAYSGKPVNTLVGFDLNGRIRGVEIIEHQEPIRLARRLRLPATELPEMLHERLLALKYLILIGLFGVSLQSLSTAERLAEVEPFKTVTALHFNRAWPFVAYVLALLLIGLFVRKFFCRYLCPLGAALTFPGRFRIFDWLRRRRECGRPCQICALECEARAIRPTGEINDLECHYCLDCQVTYWNEHKCPPLVEKRKRRSLKVKLRQDAQASGVFDEISHPLR